MRLGIYGGTFDPPHLGHLTALKKSVSQLRLDRVLVIPTSQPPHKAGCEDMASGEDRLEMCRICFSSAEKAEICDIEVKRGGVSWTVDTVRQLRELYPNDELFLLMGTDMYLIFEQWREFREISDMAVCGVFIRATGEEEKVAAHSAYMREKYGTRTELIRNVPVEISSTELREHFKARGGREYLPDEVYGYIVRHGLFGVKADFDWMRVQAYTMLREQRVRHVSGVEAEAVKLAKRWGADLDEAREAAILHDVTKYLNLQEQLNLCEKYGIILDDMERIEVKLLHSKTGAAIAKAEFHSSDAVFGAIMWHTTGRADMTLLEKIIYLADYVEPNRDFEGVVELRDMCYEDIDEALRMGFKMSLDDMLSRNMIPHVNSIKALEWLS